MKKLLLLVLIFTTFLHVVTSAETAVETPAEAPAQRSREDQRRDILRFGTETEIANLIQTLRNENESAFDAEIIEIAKRTRNRGILTGIFGFFADTEKSGLEERAIRAINDRDYETPETVLAAIGYLGRVRAAEAVDVLKELINTGETRFLNTAIRALGRAANGHEEISDSTALFLLDYFEYRRPADENRREIIVAIGETGSNKGVSFLSGMITNNDERIPLRMAALEAMSKIGDADGLDAVIEAVSSPDPNVRSTAVAALGPFSGEEVENAILEAFRDSFYRTRVGAARAAGTRQLESAIPFLRFRAENDTVPAVRDASIRALGAINSEESMAILDSLFTNRRNSDSARVLAADMLVRNDGDKFGIRVAMEMDDARTRNQTHLYNGFVRVLATARSNSLEDFARRLINGPGGVIERSLALDIVLNNELRSLEREVRTLLDERRHGQSIAQKAQRTLDMLGLVESDTPEDAEDDNPEGSPSYFTAPGTLID